MGKRRIVCLLIVLLVLASATACSGGGGYSESAAYSSTANAADEGGGYYASPQESTEYEALAETPMEAGGAAVSSASSGRKIITTVDLRMESTEYDRCVNSIYKAIEAAGGYIEYSDITGSVDPVESLDPVSTAWMGGAVKQTGASESRTYYGDRRLFLRIRVPQSGLAGFLSQVESFGNVLTKKESAEDVTLTYVDLESHIKALQTEQEQLLGLLGQAASVEEMILLQDRLSQVRYQIESYSSQLRVLENQVSYSTVNLSLGEVVVYTEPAAVNPTVGERISKGFSRTISDIKTYWVDQFVWVAVNIIYIAALLLVLAAVILLVRRVRRRK